ncbi:MAG: hypothetical protein IJR92_01630, partial [Alphaproteobacteria bacterium]|nr:hypothetical protein [Alphaproteobacteria bacterium]
GIAEAQTAARTMNAVNTAKIIRGTKLTGIDTTTKHNVTAPDSVLGGIGLLQATKIADIFCYNDELYYTHEYGLTNYGSECNFGTSPEKCIKIPGIKCCAECAVEPTIECKKASGATIETIHVNGSDTGVPCGQQPTPELYCDDTTNTIWYNGLNTGIVCDYYSCGSWKESPNCCLHNGNWDTSISHCYSSLAECEQNCHS